MLVILLLFQTQSLPQSKNYNKLGIIYINEDGTYTLFPIIINVSCEEWWETNRLITENEDHQEGENLYNHTVYGKPVIGYFCNY